METEVPSISNETPRFWSHHPQSMFCPFYDGAFNIAIKSQKPIIAGLIFNTKKIYPTNSKIWAWPMPIHIHFLEPVSTDGLSLEDTSALKQKLFQQMD